ncbi:hypothetical protein [Bdellovibrio svalbardensis]|uniref:Lipoprotein n=1 Tax=Bdellovibrio svalbardensis TaxID=2972972 RepID=A0ABT6DDK1_9BACT|nr:hypothetical protein [Bdellovibrio svalbardensis]MDG0814873.1 hypothetical protein [Bdellovibrio svalbardensis]
MKRLLSLFICSSALLLSSCRTGGIVLRETPLNVSETRKVIVSVIGEPRMVSENGREMASKYYDKKGKEIAKMDMAKERYSTRVTILGDRRPYDIQVQVLIEDRDTEGGFELTDRDDDKAAAIAEKIKKALNQSRDSRNVIDDFRSF